MKRIKGGATVQEGFAKISTAVALLEKSMFGGLERSDPVAKIKLSAPDISVGLGLQREEAKAAIHTASLSGRLKVYAFLPHGTDAQLLSPPVLTAIICVRGGFPDHVTGLVSISGLAPAVADQACLLRDALLAVNIEEFEDWLANQRYRGRWPSQYERKQPRRGRPLLQNKDLRNQIIAVVRDRQWAGEHGVPALRAILIGSNATAPSEDTLGRMLRRLYIELGEGAFCVSRRRGKR